MKVILFVVSRTKRLEAVELDIKYRSLQMLQSRANDTFRYMLATVKVLFLLLAIRCIYGVVKMNGILQILNLNCTIGLLVFLTFTFRALGQVFAESQSVLMTQKSFRGGDKWFRRFLRSCRPLRFEIARLYFVDPPMSLTMGSFVLENVANLLLLAA